MFEVTDNVFYMLVIANKKWVSETEDEAVSQLKDMIKEIGNPEKVAILSVDASKEKWEIKQIPWAGILMKVLAGDKE